jgi:hypothetical protein
MRNTRRREPRETRERTKVPVVFPPRCAARAFAKASRKQGWLPLERKNNMVQTIARWTSPEASPLAGVARAIINGEHATTLFSLFSSVYSINREGFWGTDMGI